jgi:hypothetical protein
VNLVRVAVFGAAALLMAGGYFASQAAFINGRAAEYAKSIDTPQIQLIALLLFVGCVVLACLPQQEGDGQ